MTKQLSDLTIGIKGAGEMASAIAWRIHQCGIKHIFMMEDSMPLAVRRRVSFCEVVHCKTHKVEGVTAVLANDFTHIPHAWEKGRIPVIVDPQWQTISRMAPDVVLDAIIAKKNLGTRKSEAPLVIGLGPGFEAGTDVHLVIETHRGHNLGRVMTSGCAQANTGIPGPICGLTFERVIRAPENGIMQNQCHIGMMIAKGETVATVGSSKVTAGISGVIRGLIKNGTRVSRGLKIGDIDPRGEKSYCDTISDKARTVSGGVIEAIFSRMTTRELKAP